jgi:hypothetical protein
MTISEVLSVPGLKELYVEAQSLSDDPFLALFQDDGTVEELLSLYGESKNKHSCSVIADLIKSPRRSLLRGVIAKSPVLIMRLVNSIVSHGRHALSHLKANYSMSCLRAVASHRDSSDRSPFFENV